MIHAAPPPQPPPAVQVFSLDWVALSRAHPGFRGAWERPAEAPGLPAGFAPPLPALKPAPLRLGVSHRKYWVGPVSDFALHLGYAMLGGHWNYSQSSWWAPEAGARTDLGLAAPVFQPVFHPRAHPWEYPPVQVWILESPR